MIKKLKTIMTICVSALVLTSCTSGNTYRLAQKMYDYKKDGSGYEQTLKMAEEGNYDANCEDCFKGTDSKNISLLAYACQVDIDFAKAIYDNGADIESSNSDFPQTPLLAALDGNRNNPEIVYWLIDEGADIDAVDYDKCSVFHYLRYWEDNDETQELISYFIDNCDMEYLEEETDGCKLADWDEMWDEDGDFVFYRK